jgi:hypothetical protein
MVRGFAQAHSPHRPERQAAGGGARVFGHAFARYLEEFGKADGSYVCSRLSSFSDLPSFESGLRDFGEPSRTDMFSPAANMFSTEDPGITSVASFCSACTPSMDPPYHPGSDAYDTYEASRSTV